ncbi:insulinase family protein [Candidatus Villigracilis saccharophilus]|uniref:M16 family metallopeptidase n=1 Tax=Candidatus Villigracilis saccharophilus TaxID=3140684 RepID=UPI003136D5E8|nr:insulinase family protein [Anaerolineales bacterium]
MEDLPLLLGLLAESLTTPTFPADEVEKLRAQLLTGLAIRAQDTMDLASMAFERMLFENHPYGRPSDGFIETIQSITRKDMQEFHRLHFGPKGMVVAIVGRSSLKKLLKRWSASSGIGMFQVRLESRNYLRTSRLRKRSNIITR